MNIRIALAHIPPEYLSAIQTSIEKHLAHLHITAEFLILDVTIEESKLEEYAEQIQSIAQKVYDAKWIIVDITNSKKTLLRMLCGLADDLGKPLLKINNSKNLFE